MCQFLNKRVEKEFFVAVFWLELKPSLLGLLL